MKLKTIKIKGKDYVTEPARIKHIRNVYKHTYSLTTEILEMTASTVLMKAIITEKETGFVTAEGTAFESKESQMINKQSHIENCETSAWGRALGNFGIGIDDSIASYEEVSTAIKNENKISKVVSTKREPTVIKLLDVDEVKFMTWISKLPAENKNMIFIKKYLDDKNYNYTEVLGKKITKAIK